jgi:hypothetical protein
LLQNLESILNKRPRKGYELLEEAPKQAC